MLPYALYIIHQNMCLIVEESDYFINALIEMDYVTFHFLRQACKYIFDI